MPDKDKGVCLSVCRVSIFPSLTYSLVGSRPAGMWFSSQQTAGPHNGTICTSSDKHRPVAVRARRDVHFAFALLWPLSRANFCRSSCSTRDKRYLGRDARNLFSRILLVASRTFQCISLGRWRTNESIASVYSAHAAEGRKEGRRFLCCGFRFGELSPHQSAALPPTLSLASSPLPRDFISFSFASSRISVAIYYRSSRDKRARRATTPPPTRPSSQPVS